RTAVEDADIIESQEAAFENVLAEAVLAINPPSKVQEQLAEGGFQEIKISRAAPRHVATVEEQGSPGVDGRIDVAEVPFVSGNLTVGMKIPSTEYKLDLPLGEVDIHSRQRQSLKCEVPCRIPRILPFVRHRHDVVINHVEPFA